MEAYPVKAVIFLGQAEENDGRRLRYFDAIKAMISQITVNGWNPQFVEKIWNLTEDFAAQIPVFEYGCNMEEAAVDTFRESAFGYFRIKEHVKMNLTNVFIDILRSAMTQTSCDMIEGLSTQDWEKIYDISQKQQLAPMIYQQIFQMNHFKIVIQGFSSSGREIRSIRQGNQARKSILFLMLFDKMRQNGLTPLIVKGIVCRDLYPNPDLRTSNDEDLYIPRDQFGKMDEFCRQRDL